MITKDNFKYVLEELDFTSINNGEIFTRHYDNSNCDISVNYSNEQLIYPDGIKYGRKTTCDFHQNENFVVFECVCKLLERGYKPENIELEATLGNDRGATDTFLDILVKDFDNKNYLIIECKTAGKEFEDHWKKVEEHGGQLFNYFTLFRTNNLCMYASDFVEGKIKRFSNLIILKDIESYLLESKKTGYKELLENSSSTGKDFFKIWTETYEQSYLKHGIFEDNVKPFEISDKITPNFEDLQEVSDYEKTQKLYNQFAEIMRQHNISGRENAFDKLVNLFLAKVYDEENNKKELKFNWKGIAYDDYFTFQDRLQELYSKGMYEALSEKVTHIEDKKIYDTFRLFINDKDATRDEVIKLFREQKYFSNNDFSFLDVHNEDLFKKNIVVLIKVVQMLQDIKLRTENQHQFLGDLFEGFLDQGVKQSEGQFFTPLPIVRFLISSLPLESIIKSSDENPKVIDYACGAGHFLTEYANQVEPIYVNSVEEKKKDFETQAQYENRINLALEKVYKNIYGIEKEYRLSKVSKVSAYMYGMKDINIIFADALSRDKKFENKIVDGTFSVLVANPPYSVKGFLETLSVDERKRFELFSDDLNLNTNNSIETFFVERASQLLKSDGVAAIILPSSVLSNGNIYIKCREIILEKFDIVAIFESGSGTFGKTGTNTATLFLRKKKSNPFVKDHFKNRVEKWFKADFSVDEVFSDFSKLEDYCSFCNFNFEDYKTLLFSNPNENLLKNELFKEYEKAAKQQSGYKNIEKKKISEKYTQEMKDSELRKFTVDCIKSVEKDKLYFYLLAKDNPQNVLVIKSPNDNKEIKNFLGYEWSGAKGSEGIKYLGAKVDDDENELSKNKGINNTKTPLFNPFDFDDSTKLNYYIKQNFLASSVTLPENLRQFASFVPLVDMLDFSRTTFDKAIKTQLKNDNGELKIESKYPLKTVEQILIEIKGNKPKIEQNQILENGKYPVITQEVEKVISGYTNLNDCVSDLPVIVFGDHSCSVKYVDFPFVRGADGTQLLKTNQNEINLKYFYFYLQSIKISNSERYERHFKYLKTEKIPLPPKDIQESIVSECEKIDKEYSDAQKKIEECKNEISAIMENVKGTTKKLGEIATFKNGLNYDKSSSGEVIKIVGVKDFQDRFSPKMDDLEIVQIDGTVSDDYLLKDNDLLIVRSNGSRNLVGRCVLITDVAERISYSGFTIRIRLTDNCISEKVLCYYLRSDSIRTKMMTDSKGSNIKSISQDILYNFTIPVPSLADQKKIVEQITTLEEQISDAKKVMADCPQKKAEVLKNWL